MSSLKNQSDGLWNLTLNFFWLWNPGGIKDSCGGYGMMYLLAIFKWFCFRCYVVGGMGWCVCWLFSCDSVLDVMYQKLPTVRQSDSPTSVHAWAENVRQSDISWVVRPKNCSQVIKDWVSRAKLWSPARMSQWWNQFCLSCLTFFISGRPSLDPLDQDSIGPLDHGLCWSSWSWTLLVLLIHPFKVQNDEATLLEDDVIFITWEVHGSMNGTMNARWTRGSAQTKDHQRPPMEKCDAFSQKLEQCNGSPQPVQASDVRQTWRVFHSQSLASILILFSVSKASSLVSHKHCARSIFLCMCIVVLVKQNLNAARMQAAG